MAVCFQCHLLTASAGDYDNFELFLSQSVFSPAAIIPSGRGLFRASKRRCFPAHPRTFSAREVSCPAREVYLPRKKVGLPSKKVSFPRRTLNLPTDSLTFPARTGYLPRKKVNLPDETGYFPSETRYFLTGTLNRRPKMVNFADGNLDFPARKGGLPGKSDWLPPLIPAFVQEARLERNRMLTGFVRHRIFLAHNIVKSGGGGGFLRFAALGKFLEIQAVVFFAFLAGGGQQRRGEPLV